MTWIYKAIIHKELKILGIVIWVGLDAANIGLGLQILKGLASKAASKCAGRPILRAGEIIHQVEVRLT